MESDGELGPDVAKFLTAELLLRLIPERHPSKNLVAHTGSNLPILPSYFVEGVRHGGAPPVYMQVTVPDKPVLPPSVPLQGPPVMQTTSPVSRKCGNDRSRKLYNVSFLRRSCSNPWSLHRTTPPGISTCVLLLLR